jgi:hypothetical protein
MPRQQGDELSFYSSFLSDSLFLCIVSTPCQAPLDVIGPAAAAAQALYIEQAIAQAQQLSTSQVLEQDRP